MEAVCVCVFFKSYRYYYYLLEKNDLYQTGKRIRRLQLLISRVVLEVHESPKSKHANETAGI